MSRCCLHWQQRNLNFSMNLFSWITYSKHKQKRQMVEMLQSYLPCSYQQNYSNYLWAKAPPPKSLSWDLSKGIIDQQAFACIKVLNLLTGLYQDYIFKFLPTSEWWLEYKRVEQLLKSVSSGTLCNCLLQKCHHQLALLHVENIDSPLRQDRTGSA